VQQSTRLPGNPLLQRILAVFSLVFFVLQV